MNNLNNIILCQFPSSSTIPKTDSQMESTNQRIKSTVEGVKPEIFSIDNKTKKIGSIAVFTATAESVTINKRKKEPILAEVAHATKSEKVNEDTCLIGPNRAVICDGVGSTKNGDMSSKLAANFLYAMLDIFPNKIDDPSKATKIMQEVLLSAHEYIRDCQRISGNDMAATASIVKIVKLKVSKKYKRYALIGNVGDSPIYIKKQDGKLVEITNYHNRSKLPKPTKRQALGKDMKIDPKVFFVRLKKDEQIIVTSNGVSKNTPSKKKLKKKFPKSLNPVDIARSIVKIKGKPRSKDSRTAAVLRAA